MKLDPKLSPLVRDFDDVWPLEVVNLLALLKYLDPRVTIGNQVRVALVVLGDMKRRVNNSDTICSLILLHCGMVCCNPDTNGTEESVHIREVSSFQGLNCMQELVCMQVPLYT